MDQPIILAFDLGDKIKVSPPIWPNHTLKIQPGDLTKFVPYGNGVYGYQKRFAENPFKSAPSQEASGGTIYFGVNTARTDFEAMLRLLAVRTDYKDYAVFTASSEKPGNDGYLTQMRIVSKFGLEYLFGALTDSEYEKFPEQQLTIGEVLIKFIETEANRWGTSWMDDSRLGGLFGGDGDYAREELAFGFMMENEYHNVYRIWSRAWLVTK